MKKNFICLYADQLDDVMEVLFNSLDFQWCEKSYIQIKEKNFKCIDSLLMLLDKKKYILLNNGSNNIHYDYLSNHFEVNLESTFRESGYTKRRMIFKKLRNISKDINFPIWNLFPWQDNFTDMKFKDYCDLILVHNLDYFYEVGLRFSLNRYVIYMFCLFKYVSFKLNLNLDNNLFNFKYQYFLKDET